MNISNYKIACCLLLLNISISVKAQNPNWQNLDLKNDGVFGISTEKAYQELLKGKKPHPVIVAILDGGTDISHKDLKSELWANPKEKPANKIDDDHNGYIDDVHGWDFIGGNQADVQYDNLELTRLIRRGDGKVHPEIQIEFDKKLKETEETYSGMLNFKNILDTIVTAVGKPEPSADDFKMYVPKNNQQGYVRKVMMEQLKRSSLPEISKAQLDEPLKYYREQLDYSLNLSYDPRHVVGDDYNNVLQRFYGNNDVTGPHAQHGTHVAGIVGAVRNDTARMKGVADHVQLMVIRAVPQGDERDKDIANGIRYAAANGARIINMSFGKYYSSNKSAVDAAVKYAISKDILLIQAAGNETINLDSVTHYPHKLG